MLLRAKALIILATLLATPANHGPGPPQLVVAANSQVENDVTAALDFRDLEHYLVFELQSVRVDNVVPASTLERSENDPAPAGGYLLEFFIEEAEIAVRPRWNWSEERFTDDPILHLEVSLTLTRDEKTLGRLYDIHDYRAKDYGAFASPHAVRGATYHAAANLVDKFVRGALNGEFGGALASIARSDTPADLLHDWNELSPRPKLVTAVFAVLIGVLVLGLAIRLVYAILQLTYRILVPRRFREPAVRSYAPLRPVFTANPDRSAPKLVAEAATDEEQDEDEEKEDEQEEESSSRE